MNSVTLEYSFGVGGGDIAIVDGRVKIQSDLNALVYTSLFQDRRAGVNELPNGEVDARGYWGDDLLGRSHGSLLWTLKREKNNADLLRKVEDISRSALDWLIEGHKILAFDIVAERLNNEIVSLLVKIKKNDLVDDAFAFNVEL